MKQNNYCQFSDLRGKGRFQPPDKSQTIITLIVSLCSVFLSLKDTLVTDSTFIFLPKLQTVIQHRQIVGIGNIVIFHSESQVQPSTIKAKPSLNLFILTNFKFQVKTISIFVKSEELGYHCTSKLTDLSFLSFKYSCFFNICIQPQILLLLDSN